MPDVPRFMSESFVPHSLSVCGCVCRKRYEWDTNLHQVYEVCFLSHILLFQLLLKVISSHLFLGELDAIQIWFLSHQSCTQTQERYEWKIVKKQNKKKKKQHI